MRCGNCGHENGEIHRSCEMCGFGLASTQAAPRGVFPAASAPASPAVKRRTAYDVAPEPVAPRPAPAAPAAPAAPPPSAAPWVAPLDPFGSASARAPLNPDDPWGAAQPVAPPVAPRPVSTSTAPVQPKSRTLIEVVGPEPSRQLRGALFEYRGATDVGRIHPLYAGQNKVGRSPCRDVVIGNDPKVSGEHGYLMLNGDQGKFMDTSTNGSFVDGVAVHNEWAVLAQGSVVQVGDVRLVFALVPTSALGGR